jgi:nitrite reductase/ring-hydroxylating ferredoxin subunit
MKSRQSNLQYFFLFLFTLIGFSSCSKDSTNINDIVPYTRIDFKTIRTWHPELEQIGTGVYFDSEGFYSSAGYKNHGIYIVNTSNGFIAMDATCTHDVDSNDHIEISEDNNLIGICPTCKSEFLFISGGAVHKNPEEYVLYPLRNYKVIYNSKTKEIKVLN